jgi:hypothetical protein
MYHGERLDKDNFSDIYILNKSGATSQAEYKYSRLSMRACKPYKSYYSHLNIYTSIYI